MSEINTAAVSNRKTWTQHWDKWMDQSCRTLVLAVGRALTCMNKKDNDVLV